ncbi:MAG TPA: glycine/sarcosine/betaine reductase selenoprotein B family protein [Nitriliruptorales bacterium]|nr:glycine/sarcosine/betaine reductase selenoprotein B family protein [Nitriliruptorales bacterium]
MNGDGQTFEQFRRSFHYGSRSDLHFKFLARLSDADGAEFLRQLLVKLGDVFDTGEYDAVRELVFDWQVRAYDREPKYRYDSGPFVAPDRPLEEMTVTLVGAGGVFVEDDDPMGGETQEEAESRIDEYLREPPKLSLIPGDTPSGDLRVRHPGYDVRGARRDVNSVFPIDALRGLAADGIVGGLASTHYGFVGAASQLELRNEVAPRWAQELVAEGVDVCLLVAT